MLPRWAVRILRWVLPADRVEDALGDLEEVHRARLAHRRAAGAHLLTLLEAVEMAGAVVLARAGARYTPPVSWIDVKLGLRMLRKHPALTLVGGLSMAFGIFVGAACFEFYSQVLHPQIPFDEGERVVDVALFDTRTREPERRLLHDFLAWRTGLTTVEDLGAARPIVPTLATGDGRAEPIRGAAMTASAFRMTRVPPLMGRTLDASDERAGAPDVVVLGHEAWRTRFGSDPDVVGRRALLAGVEHTIVGVMPEGFGFPSNEELWTPLRVEAGSIQPLQGPGVLVSGRLAEGVTLEQANAELNAVMAAARLERPEAYAQVQPQVAPYAEAFLGVTDLSSRLGVMSINVFAALFLALVCGNVALLVFARAAAREAEIVVRTALGASRRRIVLQLFTEAMALAALAGLLGITAAGWGLERFVSEVLGGNPAFWFHTSLSPRTVVYAAGLAVVGAVVAGVFPALKLTARGMESRLRGASAGGGGLRFGGVWTALIVIQVAATVTFPAVGSFVQEEAANIRAHDFGVATEEYLTARIALNPARGAGAGSDSAGASDEAARHARVVGELKDRLEADPSVRGVTLAADLPGTYHSWRRIELDEGGAAPRNRVDEEGPGRWVSGGKVAPGFFQVLGVRAVQGRVFTDDDTAPDARTVVVNQAFVDSVLGGRNPLGRRIRYLGSGERWDGVALGDEPGPWHRIVGVVPNLGMGNGASGGPRFGGFYHAVPIGSPQAPLLIARANGPAATLSGRLREVAAATDVDVSLLAVRTLDGAKEEALRLYAYWTWVIVGASGLALLLSLAGIYAVMSFTVARRTREIGVRVALGAGPARVAGAVFRRPLIQVAGGIVLGIALSGLLGWGINPEDLGAMPVGLLLAYGTLMAGVCSLACIVPVLRALRVEPAEALSAEA
ncbi:MAG: ABC transporter permease [Longimicrobiales bacterium]